MEVKSTAPYPPPPAYSSTTPYPGLQTPPYGYPYPATTGTPNHPAAPPTVEIGVGEVHTVEPHHNPSSMVVVHKYQHPYPKLQCCLGVIFSIFFVIVAIVVLVKIVGVTSDMSSAKTPRTPTFPNNGGHPSW